MRKGRALLGRWRFAKVGGGEPTKMGPSNTVLMIDDSPALHDVLRTCFAKEALTLHFAMDAASGMEMARGLGPDLILLDVGIPGEDGFEICRKLKMEAATKDAQIIFLTAASSAADKLRGLEIGAIDYITKPFDIVELGARVRAALRTKHLLDELSEKAHSLEMSEKRFRFLAEYSADLISRHQINGGFSYASPASLRILGYASDELCGLSLRELIHGDEIDLVQRAVERARQSAEPQTMTFRARRKNGRFIWLESTVRGVKSGRVSEIHMTSRDVSARKQVESMEQGRAHVLEMIAANEPLADILHTLVAMVEEEYPQSHVSIVLLAEGRLEQIAPTLPGKFKAAMDTQLLRLAADLCSGDVSERHGVICSDITTNSYWEKVRGAAAEHGLNTCWSLTLKAADDEALGMFAIYLREKRKPDEGAISILNMAARLISIASENRQLTHQLSYRAYHDSLTGLPNRMLFEDRLNQAIGRAQRTGQSLATFCIDLDRFKFVNDTLGHHAGDILLSQFSARVAGMLREVDTLARLGGDEFALILPEMESRTYAGEFAQRLVEAMKEPFEIVGQEIYVTASIGVAVAPDDGNDAIALEKNADVAMYRAKAMGRNGFQLFASEMVSGGTNRLEMESLLRRAWGNREFMLYYQPQFDRFGNMVALEALLRWTHAKLGPVPPSKFVPMAEESGLIIELGEWVLEEACGQAARWQAKGLPPVRVAVNVSALQFSQSDFPATIERVLKKHKLDPRWLELEITETLLMKNTLDAAAKLEKIRAKGVSIALDDFGTGYSSLAYLQWLPIDTLKIDRSFIRDIDLNSEGSDAVVRAIMSLGHGLKMKVVAEGVETDQQRQFLWNIGCNAMQGYLFGEAVPAAQLEPRLPKAVA
jgi:diguanylate cyclase (GGDEF)-like protein/PAS domain S-box-containing protein